MSMVIDRITTSALDPFDLEMVKAHCRVDGTYDDSTITGMAKAAALEVEKFAQVALLTQTIRVTYEPLPLASWVNLPVGPVLPDASVTMTIDGVATEAFTLGSGKRPYIRLHGSIMEEPTFGAVVVIEYAAGFGADASDIPADLAQAIKDQALAFYDGRAPDAKFQALSPHMARISARYRRVAL